MKIVNGDETIALTVILVGAGAGTFASFCPSWFTVRSAFFHEQSHKPGNIAAIRQGEAVGTAITLAEGVAASYLTKSLLPFFGAVTICAVMVIGYEYSIAHPAIEDSDDEDSPVPKLGAWRYEAS